MDTVSSDHVFSFLTSLAIGLLIGVEREKAGSPMGLRTSALASIFGGIAALVGQSIASPFFLVGGLLVIGGIAMVRDHAIDSEAGPSGPTTRMSIILCYSLGAMVWLGHGRFAVMLAIITAALLHFKTELRGLSEKITTRDMVSILQFATLSFIVLPLLPKEGYGPYGAFNPHHIWLMVVLISGVSLAGYLAIRMVGNRYGPPLLGFLGGMVSSTATTLVYARHSRDVPPLLQLSAFVILMANLIVPLRLGLIGIAVAPDLASKLLPVLVGGIAGGSLVMLWWWRQLRSHDTLPMPEVTNPTELKTALTFGAIYAAILLLVSWFSDFAGSWGLYIASVLSGLTELDAITLSTLRLHQTGKIEALQAVNAIGLATLANLAFKAGLMLWVGGMGLFRQSFAGLLAIAGGITVGMWLVN